MNSSVMIQPIYLFLLGALVVAMIIAMSVLPNNLSQEETVRYARQEEGASCAYPTSWRIVVLPRHPYHDGGLLAGLSFDGVQERLDANEYAIRVSRPRCGQHDAVLGGLGG